MDQAKQWGFSVFKEALGNFCDDGGFKLFVSLLLILLIFVCSVVIVPISIYIYIYVSIKARTSEPTSSTRL